MSRALTPELLAKIARTYTDRAEGYEEPEELLVLLVMAAELIELVYCDDAPTEWYLRGHVSEPVAIATVLAELEAEAEDGERSHVPELGAVSHRWARWGLGRDDDGELVARCFYLVDAPARGAFAVTEVRDVEDLERQRQARAQERAHAAELEAWVRDRYPEATEIRAHGYPQGRGNVRFRLPELPGDVEYRAKYLDQVLIQVRDRGSWSRLYSRRLRADREDREDHEPCAACSRPTRETNDESDPLRRCGQGEGIAYALCARCLHVAVEEAGRG